jgi:quinol monooxygenase YgiN
MIVRIFDTSVDPGDVERGKELFREQVQPAFERFEGCHGFEALIGTDEHSADLVDVVAITRWESREHIEAAVASDQYAEALAEIRTLFQQAPIVRHFETV